LPKKEQNQIVKERSGLTGNRFGMSLTRKGKRGKVRGDLYYWRHRFEGCHPKT
jgi:hypothetical protein